LHRSPTGPRQVVTTTGAENAPMIRVNHQVGYTTSRTSLVLRAEVAELFSR
jgi:hypothetical protein